MGQIPRKRDTPEASNPNRKVSGFALMLRWQFRAFEELHPFELAIPQTRRVLAKKGQDIKHQDGPVISEVVSTVPVLPGALLAAVAFGRVRGSHPKMTPHFAGYRLGRIIWLPCSPQITTDSKGDLWMSSLTAPNAIRN